MEETIQICIEPRFIDDNVPHQIEKKIKEKYVNKCNKTYGYVLDVQDIEIIDNKISRTGGNVFYTVKCKISSLKPQIGSRYVGNVCMIYEAGIFVDVQDKFKVLIPSDTLEGYKYDSEEEFFKKKGKVIKEESEIKLEITNVEFSDGIYNCIGKCL